MATAIPLTRGKYALVDDDDFQRIRAIKWYSYKGGNTFYSRAKIKGVLILMHRFILNPPSDMKIDHINGDGLDNRKENLRVVSHRENLQNITVKKSSVFPGVNWNARDQKWQATIQLNGKQKFLGLFKVEGDAGNAYKDACYKNNLPYSPIRRA